MARLAPAACSPWAIAQAIERLLATPKTTAVRFFKSSNISWMLRWKRKRITVARVERTLLSAVFDLTFDLAIELELQTSKQDQKQRQPQRYKSVRSTSPNLRRLLLLFESQLASTRCRKLPRRLRLLLQSLRSN